MAHRTDTEGQSRADSPGTGKGKRRQHGGFGRRIRQYARQYWPDEQKELERLAVATQIPYSTLVSYDDDKLPSGPTLVKIGSVKPVPPNLDWLIFNRGEMVSREPVTRSLVLRLEDAIATIHEAKATLAAASTSPPDQIAGSEPDPLFDAPVLSEEEARRALRETGKLPSPVVHTEEEEDDPE